MSLNSALLSSLYPPKINFFKDSMSDAHVKSALDSIHNLVPNNPTTTSTLEFPIRSI